MAGLCKLTNNSGIGGSERISCSSQGVIVQDFQKSTNCLGSPPNGSFVDSSPRSSVRTFHRRPPLSKVLATNLSNTCKHDYYPHGFAYVLVLRVT